MGGGGMNMTKTFDVLYYKTADTGREFSHKYSETWRLSDFHCPRCANKYVWFHDDGGDYYVGEQYICGDCKSTFYLPTGVNLIHENHEQDQQRLTHLTR